MLYRSLDQIAAEAEVLPASPELSRRERLERWTELLERAPERHLRALRGIEYGSPQERVASRADGSPLTVAYADPVLRAAGLRGDTAGDAAEFFGLSHEQLHYLLCSCHHGQTVTARTVATQVRALVRSGDVAVYWV